MNANLSPGTAWEESANSSSTSTVSLVPMRRWKPRKAPPPSLWRHVNRRGIQVLFTAMIFSIRPVFGLLLALLSLACSQRLAALPVSGLYAHEVVVAGQSVEERNRAFQEALAAVVVKVTGDSRWLENSAVRQALQNAGNLVQEIQYRSETVTPPPPTDVIDPGAQASAAMPQQISYMNVIFAREPIDRLLANAAIPVWDSNRPSVLIWVVLQYDNGERRMLSADSQPEIIDYIQQFARLRGVPILFPVLDFEDRQTLSLEQLWALDSPAIERASGRYGADSILAGRLHLSGNGDLVGLWQFSFRDQVLNFDSFDTDLKNYVFEPLDLVTTRLAEHFAIIRPDSSEEKVRMLITGVRNLGAYTELLTMLQGLSIVNGVVTSSLEGESLELELSLLGSRQQLYELIALDRALLPVNERPAETDSILSYRWTR